VTTRWVIRKAPELQVLEVGQLGQADMEWRAWPAERSKLAIVRTSTKPSLINSRSPNKLINAGIQNKLMMPGCEMALPR
jgi:hypothetical protein